MDQKASASRSEAVPHRRGQTGCGRPGLDRQRQGLDLRIELVKLQRWSVPQGLVCIVFEGATSAGKGGIEITSVVRVMVVALSATRARPMQRLCRACRRPARWSSRPRCGCARSAGHEVSAASARPGRGRCRPGHHPRRSTEAARGRRIGASIRARRRSTRVPAAGRVLPRALLCSRRPPGPRAVSDNALALSFRTC